MNMKKYFLYARRSTVSDGKQVLSIESQLKEMKQLSKRLGLDVIEPPFIESMSSKAPGRPVFNEMISRIQSGEAQGILCWKIDRLARNPIDGGQIIWLLKEYGIEIVTSSQTYSQSTDASMMMYLEFGIAQKFIDDLGKNSKRGMKTKAEKGWYPAPAPIGYLNTPDKQKGFKTIIVDKSKYPLVRKAFDDVISGKQPMSVWRTIRDNRSLLNKSGKPISRSAFYYIITNPFYTGDFEWPRNSGAWYKGQHKPLITTEEFEIVQRMLGRHGKPISRSHQFDLTGLMRCAECNCAVTATKKTKYYKRTNRTATYTYYHCSHRNPNQKCFQIPVTETEMNNEIGDLLLSIRLKPEFIEWAKKWLKALYDKESAIEHSNLESQNYALEKVEKKLSALLDMRLDGKVDEHSYESKKAELEEEKFNLKSHIEGTGSTLSDQRIKIENALDFAYASFTKFNTGSREDKHHIMTSLGSNLMMENKKVRITLKKYLEVCTKQENWKENYKDWLEPQEYSDLLAKRPDLRPAIPNWLPR